MSLLSLKDMGMISGECLVPQALLCSLHHKTASQWVTLRLFPLPQCLWGMGRGWWLEAQDPAEDWGSPTLQPPAVSHCPFRKPHQAFTTLPPVPYSFLAVRLQSIPGKHHIVSSLPVFVLFEPTGCSVLGQKCSYA